MGLGLLRDSSDGEDADPVKQPGRSPYQAGYGLQGADGLHGVAGGNGKQITNLSTTGDAVVLTYYSANAWFASSNGWTMEA